MVSYQPGNSYKMSGILSDQYGGSHGFAGHCVSGDRGKPSGRTARGLR
jgi:hypothetical protein